MFWRLNHVLLNEEGKNLLLEKSQGNSKPRTFEETTSIKNTVKRAKPIHNRDTLALRNSHFSPRLITTFHTLCKLHSALSCHGGRSSRKDTVIFARLKIKVASTELKVRLKDQTAEQNDFLVLS